MGIVAIPVGYDDGNVLTAANLDLCNTVIYGEFNGNIDDTNIKVGANINGSKLLNNSIVNAKLTAACIGDSNLDYTSVRVLRAGPNAPSTGTGGRRLACGIKAFSIAGLPSVAVTVVFSTDCQDGNPQFASAPVLTFGLEHDATIETSSIKIIDRLASGFTVEIIFTGNVTLSGELNWMASGAI